MPVEDDLKRDARRRRSDLRQWGAEQVPQPHPTQADLNALHGHDPKKLLFMSFDKNNKDDYADPSLVPLFEKVAVAAISGLLAVAGYRQQPTIYHLNSAKEGAHNT